MRFPRTVLSAGVAAAGLAVAGCFWGFGRGGETLRLPGVVEIQEVRLGSKLGGRVAEVLTFEGAEVKPGQPLVRFAMPEMEAQRQQWQARLQASEADLERVKNGPRPEEKDAAKAAAEAAKARLRRMMAGYRTEEVRQAKSDLESAEADLKLAREDFDRADRLFRQGSIAKAELDASRASRDRAAGRAAAFKARADWMIAGNRPEDIEEANADYKKAQANSDLLQAGSRSEDIAESQARVAENRGRLREIEANLEEAEVRAPEKAVVEVLAVRKGDLVPPNQPVLRVLRADDLWVKVYVPETQLGQVRLNQPVEVTIDSYPGRKFAGVVIQVANLSEFTPRNVQSVDERRHQVFAIKVQVPDPQGIFKSGMAAEVTFRLGD